MKKTILSIFLTGMAFALVGCSAGGGAVSTPSKVSAQSTVSGGTSSFTETSSDETTASSASAASSASGVSDSAPSSSTGKSGTGNTRISTTAVTRRTAQTVSSTSTQPAATKPAPPELKKAQQLAGLFDSSVREEVEDISVGADICMHFPDMVWFNGKIYAYYISYPAGYEGRPCIGVAVSSDGTNFTRVTDSAIVAGPEEYDYQMASFAGAWNDNGTIYVVYEAKPKSGGANIALATSTDGVHFTKQGVILNKDKKLKWQNYNIGTPDLFKKDGTWYLTFHGYGKDKKDCQIGLAYGKELALGKLTMVQSPVLPTSDNPDDPDSGTTGRRDILYNEADGYFYMVYEISTDSVDGDYGKSYWTHTFARSKDFMTWEKIAPLITQSIAGMGYDGPCFLEIDGQVFVYVRNKSMCSTKIKLVSAAE